MCLTVFLGMYVLFMMCPLGWITSLQELSNVSSWNIFISKKSIVVILQKLKVLHVY